MAEQDDDQTPETIVSIDAGDWLERDELADRLGVTGQRLERTIASDHVESKTTSDGLRYRYVGPPVKADEPDQDHRQAGQKTELVSVNFDDWTEARESLARLETKLESSREDVRRAVDYARELEEECDRISDIAETRRDELDEVRARLDEERGRREQLEEEYEAVVERLEQMSNIRGRYHLERGRREEAEEEIERQREELRQLKDRLDQLTEALHRARQQGFVAELGNLTIEWRSGDVD